MIGTWVALTAQVTLAAVFAAAAYGKCRSRAALARFADGLADFRWVPDQLRRCTAVTVVATELAAVPLLFVVPRAGAALSVGMLLAFTAATVASGRAADCQCFGSGPSVKSGSGRAFLIRNGVLVTAGVLVGLVRPGEAGAAVWVTAAGVGVICGTVIAGWDELSYLLGRSATLS